MPPTGIPAIERLVGRLLIRRWCRKHPPQATAALVREQQRELIDLVVRAGPGATRPVQIRRLPGLEQSSTNYSLAMIADHLARTNTDMARAVAALAADRDPGLTVDIARYKPDRTAAPGPALDALDRSIRELESALADTAAIHSAKRTLAHPWFGPLTAATWACFPSFHQALHLRQARLVSKGLRT